MTEAERWDYESCQRLLCAIVERAAKDLRVPSTDVKTMREINRYPPVDFFERPWFEDICDYLHLDPDFVRMKAYELT